MKEAIGFIGLGAMGKWMALNLIKAGHILRVFDIDPEALAFVSKQGATPADSPAGAVAGVETVFLSLPGTAQVEEVIFGASGILSGAGAGLNIVDLSTISYTASLRFAQSLREKGMVFSDAPVSGMEARAREGDLAVMFGGEEEVFEKIMPLLESIGSEILFMGPVGSGQLTKLINQLLFDINAAGVAEVLPMAAKLGLDPEKVARVVAAGTGRSFAAEFFMPLILENTFDRGYPLKHAYKDFISASEICAEQKIPLPMVQAAMATFQTALLRGFGDEGKGALIKVFEGLLGAEFRKRGKGE